MTLPRKTRTFLAQLRSGCSNYLNRHRIDPEIEDKCPRWHASVLTTPYIFMAVKKILKEAGIDWTMIGAEQSGKQL